MSPLGWSAAHAIATGSWSPSGAPDPDAKAISKQPMTKGALRWH